jgi:AraC-like DNA-binding protein
MRVQSDRHEQIIYLHSRSCSTSLARRSITQIAYGWGFNDIGHFGKVFRKSVGMWPGSFRRQSLESATTQGAP